jgi:hypothetical protein
MSKDMKIVGYQLLSNEEIELHQEVELQGLSKARVIGSIELECNRKVGFMPNS